MSSLRGRDRPLSYPITSNINTLQIEPADFLGGIFTVFFQPPTHRFRKAADSVVQAIFPRNILPIGKLTVKDLIEILFEKSHEIDSLVNAVTNAMFHAAILYGIKYGARLTTELLE